MLLEGGCRGHGRSVSPKLSLEALTPTKTAVHGVWGLGFRASGLKPTKTAVLLRRVPNQLKCLLGAGYFSELFAWEARVFLIKAESLRMT